MLVNEIGNHLVDSLLRDATDIRKVLLGNNTGAYGDVYNLINVVGKIVKLGLAVDDVIKELLVMGSVGAVVLILYVHTEEHLPYVAAGRNVDTTKINIAGETDSRCHERRFANLDQGCGAGVVG